MFPKNASLFAICYLSLSAARHASLWVGTTAGGPTITTINVTQVAIESALVVAGHRHDFPVDLDEVCGRFIVTKASSRLLGLQSDCSATSTV